MKAALPSFSNRPILAYVIEVDGQPEFNTHAYHLDDEDNVIYDEIPIGIIPESCNAKLEYDEEKEKTYCVVNGYIFEEYAPIAIEILEREEECFVSVELSVRELSYDSKEKILCIDDFFFSGVTVLGKTEDGEEVKPGMAGSNIKLADFSAENNSFIYNKDDFINEITTAVIERLSDIDNRRKEGETVAKDFENKIEEEVTEEVTEETTEEETLVVTEASDEAEETAVETPEVVDEEFENEDSTLEAEEKENIKESEEEENTVEEFDGESGSEEEDPIVDDDEQEPGYKNRQYTVNGITFETSLSEIQFAISELVNNTYAENDNDYYSVEVYEGSKTIVMVGWFSGHAYRQSYKVRNDVYSLVGDRVSVKAVYVTSDEEAELDRMRSNYSSISDKLAKYESEPEKMDILNSSDYANIADHADFEELKKQENHFDLTVDELKEKADAMLLAYAKSGKLKFASNVEQHNEEPKKDFFAFARFEQNTSFLDSLLNKK
jgi:hypothetical protein